MESTAHIDVYALYASQSKIRTHNIIWMSFDWGFIICALFASKVVAFGEPKWQQPTQNHSMGCVDLILQNRRIAND